MSKKLTDFQTPMGQQGNLFSLTSWTSMILGTVVLIATFGIGQSIAQKLNGKGPIDTDIEPIFKNPAANVVNPNPYNVI